MPQPIIVGDTVAYSERFLNRQNHYPSDMPSALGTVKAIHRLNSGVILADIEWDKPALPKRVNVKHLTKAKASTLGHDRG
jgi:hypothetical protein